MDNKINEIRRPISTLRAKMLDAEASIRGQINRDLDCTESSVQLMAMRREMVSLIGRRDALGGWEACPTTSWEARDIAKQIINGVLASANRSNDTSRMGLPHREESTNQAEVLRCSPASRIHVRSANAI
jgi:hypothetical protein